MIPLDAQVAIYASGAMDTEPPIWSGPFSHWAAARCPAAWPDDRLDRLRRALAVNPSQPIGDGLVMVLQD